MKQLILFFMLASKTVLRKYLCGSLNRTDRRPTTHQLIPLSYDVLMTSLLKTRTKNVFASIDFSCFVLYLTKILLSKICILHYLVPLNSYLFKRCLFRFTLEGQQSYWSDQVRVFNVHIQSKLL